MSLDADSVSDVLSGSSSNGIGSDSLNSPVSNEQRRETFDLKDEDMCGVVYGCQYSCVAVGLMNLKAETSHIFSVAAPDGMTIDFARYHAFALVGSKLFAIGGEPMYLDDDEDVCPQPVYPREVYSCDLSTLNSGEALKFKEVATLQEPKISALLVPYKDKLFIIADPCQEPTPTNNPCEILRNLNQDKPTVCRLNPPPFWEGDDDASRLVVKLNGHVVARNRLYVRVQLSDCVETYGKMVTSWTWYCLNMDTDVWEDSECDVPLLSILKDVYDKGDKRPLTYVYGDKLFELEWDEDSCIPTFKAVVKLKDDDDKVVIDLKCIVESMGLTGIVFDGWVLPCNEHNSNVFCLMIWLQDPPIFRDYIRVCKFKLSDDGSFDILTKQVVTCGPFPKPGLPFVGFTPAINKELNAGDYKRKLFKEELERMEAESYKDFEEACAIQFKDDISPEEKEEDHSSCVELDLAKIVENFKSNLLKNERAKLKKNKKKVKQRQSY